MDATLISDWNALVNSFFPAFTQPTGPVFARLLAGWVLCTVRRTVTGMIRWADPDGLRAHDAYHRLLRDAAWSMDELWRRVLQWLVQRFCPIGVIWLDLDDTLFHRSGRRVNGAGRWRDPVRSTATKVVHAWGLNLVVVTLRVTPPWGGCPLGLPILMRVHRKDGPTLIELAGQMLDRIAEWLPDRTFRVGADGFYASLAGSLRPGMHLTSRLRRDAALFELPTPRPKGSRGPTPKRGRRLPAPAEIAKRTRQWQRVKTNERGRTRYRLVHVRQVLWYHVSKAPILLVISRDPDRREKDDILFTTDVTMSAAEVISHYAGRWSIEETFKQTKQMLGGQQAQSWKREGPERAAALSLWLYSTVWLWYLQQRPSRFTFWAQPWYPTKTAPSFADALACLRAALWRRRIIAMFGENAVHDKKYLFLIEALAAAA